MTIPEVAAAVVAALSPYAPFLVDAAKAGGARLAETVAEHGGEAAWKRATALWDAVRGHLGEPADVKGAALMLSADTGSEEYRHTLAAVLARHLEAHPAAVEELVELLGGERAAQTVLARSGSRVEDVAQDLGAGGGTQHVEAAGDSVIRGVRQTRG